MLRLNRQSHQTQSQPKLSDLPDTDLVSKAQEGHSMAFSELLKRHQDKIFNTAYRFCGNHDDATEITQRTFIKAYKGIHLFKGDSSFSTWLYRITFNESVSLKRDNFKIKEVSFHTHEEESMTHEPVDHQKNPMDRLKAKEDQQKVQEALNELDEAERKLIILKDVEGLSYKEIGEIMDITTSLVRNRLHKARLNLKDKLRPLIGALL